MDRWTTLFIRGYRVRWRLPIAHTCNTWRKRTQPRSRARLSGDPRTRSEVRMATAYLSPGVYVEEVDRGSKPIEGVGTAVAAFIGFAEKGPVGQPTLVTNWSQFTNTFGSFVKGGYLAPSLYGYFNNGGGTAYVTRLAGEISTNGHNGHTSAKAPVMAALPAHTAGGLPSLEFTALDPGTTPGDISIDIRPAEQGAPDDQFTVVIKRGDADAETFPNLTFGKARGGRNVV